MCLHCMVLWEAEVDRRAQAKREADALAHQQAALEQGDTTEPDATGYSGSPAAEPATRPAGDPRGTVDSAAAEPMVKAQPTQN